MNRPPALPGVTLTHRAQFLEVGPMTDSSDMTHRMFDFLSGDPEEILAYKDLGVLPWWSEDELKFRFWRPLSSFTHVVDYTLWPASGVLMHVHNVAWLAALVAVTALLYRRLIAIPMIGGLATLLCALDDAHGMPAAFLANRNAMVAASFGVLSLWLHDRFRRGGWTPGGILSPLAFLAALLGGESGIGIAPYLLGYAIFMERRSGAARFATIAPHAVVGIAWLVFYKSGGYGTFGSGFYLDPMGQPAEWFSHFLIRAPLLLLGQWFLPPSTFAFAWTQAQTLGIAAFGVVVRALVFFLSRPILREDPTARFFAFGMLLAVVPISAGFPHDRLLFCVGIGAAPLLAMLLARLFDRSELEAPPEPSPDPSPDPRWVLDFDGKNDVVLAEPFVAPEGTHFSVTLWLRADRFQDHQTLLALYPQQKQARSDWSLELQHRSADEARLRFNMRRADGRSMVSAGDPQLSRLRARSWAHAVAVYDHGKLRLYLNGRLVGEKHMGARQNSVMTFLSIGGPDGSRANKNGYQEYFNGRIDDLRIYDRVLSIEEIESLYSSGRP